MLTSSFVDIVLGISKTLGPGSTIYQLKYCLAWKIQHWGCLETDTVLNFTSCCICLFTHHLCYIFHKDAQ